MKQRTPPFFFVFVFKYEGIVKLLYVKSVECYVAVHPEMLKNCKFLILPLWSSLMITENVLHNLVSCKNS